MGALSVALIIIALIFSNPLSSYLEAKTRALECNKVQSNESSPK